MTGPYAPEQISRAELDQRAGELVVQFGTNWCGWCRRAEPLIDEAFAPYAAIERLKIDDGPGRPLGRSFRIKLWPTLIFMKDGQEVARVTRPGSAADVSAAIAMMSS